MPIESYFIALPEGVSCGVSPVIPEEQGRGEALFATHLTQNNAQPSPAISVKSPLAADEDAGATAPLLFNEDDIELPLWCGALFFSQETPHEGLLETSPGISLENLLEEPATNLLEQSLENPLEESEALSKKENVYEEKKSPVFSDIVQKGAFLSTVSDIRKTSLIGGGKSMTGANNALPIEATLGSQQAIEHSASAHPLQGPSVNQDLDQGTENALVGDPSFDVNTPHTSPFPPSDVEPTGFESYKISAAFSLDSPSSPYLASDSVAAPQSSEKEAFSTSGVWEHVRETCLRGHGHHELVIHVHPKELGSIRIALSIDNDKRIHGTCVASNALICERLEEDSGLLTQQLKDQGFDVASEGFSFQSGEKDSPFETMVDSLGLLGETPPSFVRGGAVPAPSSYQIIDLRL